METLEQKVLKVPIPDGYEIVTEGTVHPNDLFYDSKTQSFQPTDHSDLGEDVDCYARILRKRK